MSHVLLIDYKVSVELIVPITQPIGFSAHMSLSMDVYSTENCNIHIALSNSRFI